ncbi:MAG: VIT1/CCC1 transporter family protein [Bradyrhizobiaceae bacterium]|nr:VIT1/CCC1 transporter family protein [Bradyrhizobiaceae bacterium]
MAKDGQHSHEPDAIAERLSRGPSTSYLPDAIYGAIDGTVTTFAILASAVGAHLPPRVIIILGVANLVADGFSMAAGNFTATRTALQRAAHLREVEHRHIEQHPKGEEHEIRQIYRNKGFTGSALESITSLITSRRRVWIDTMLAEEYGVAFDGRSPLRAALATYAGFIAAGSLPLIPFVFGLENSVAVATMASALAFFLIGSAKSRWSVQSWWASGLETLGIGIVAAGFAYGVGALIERLV